MRFVPAAARGGAADGVPVNTTIHHAFKLLRSEAARVDAGLLDDFQTVMEGEAIYLPGFFTESPKDYSLLLGMMADLEQAGKEVREAQKPSNPRREVCGLVGVSTHPAGFRTRSSTYLLLLPLGWARRGWWTGADTSSSRMQMSSPRPSERLLSGWTRTLTVRRRQGAFSVAPLPNPNRVRFALNKSELWGWGPFPVEIFATRLNLYRDGLDWKPFHHDSHAYAGGKKEDFTIGASFGAERSLAFQHPSGHEFTIPQRNGDIFAFTSEVNKRFKHGVPRVRAPPPLSVISAVRRPPLRR
jgi:alkylated DNA repair dioxygenase AlkB